MIKIICAEETYLYHAYHMTKAFYPSAELASQVEEKASNYVTVQFEDGDRIEVGRAEVDRAEVDRVETAAEESDRTGEAGAEPDRTEAAVAEPDRTEAAVAEPDRIEAAVAEPDRIEAAGRQDADQDLKHRIDLALYRLLSRKSRRQLSWGTLMGVRPTKLAMRKLEEGAAQEEFLRWYQKEYLVSEEKAALSWEIALREKELLDRLDLERGYSLYVGIPFCPTVCSYCSFSSGALSDWKDRVEDYLDALCRELQFIAKVSRDRKLNAIYIGGGTPTTLTAGQLERLLACIDTHFSREHLLEYTIEAGRPDSISYEKLRVIREHGVTRISINPQTMQQKTLDAIGRKHTVEEVRESFLLARELGFDNINMDLIAGLPGETVRDMEDTLRQVEELSPDNLTVHSLAIKRAAKMGQKGSREQQEILKDREDTGRMSERIGQMIEKARISAGRMGLFPYYLYRQKNIAGNFENVGYAKVDKAGIYNILIMEEKQSIVAAGAGASTKIVLEEPVLMPGSRKKKMTSLYRQENVKAIDAYIGRVDEMIERKGEWLWR